MKYIISPHQDDAVLFASYIIQREKPIVISVVHPTLQEDNTYERILEDYKAMKILDVPIMFLKIDEDKLNENNLYDKLFDLKDSQGDDEVWIPEYEENGNPQHNLVNKVANQVWEDYNIHTYKTYTGLEDRTIGKEIIPTKEELELKKQAMACYNTQINNPLTKHYFENYKEYE